MTLQDELKRLGYTPIDNKFYLLIQNWKSWYRGRVDSFHNYKIYNSGRELKRERATLNMAYQGCAFWAGLLWNSECAVNLDNSDADKAVNSVLAANAFAARFSDLIEKAFALGTGAVIAYRSGRFGDEIKLDFITADCVYPLEWYGAEVASCAFAARKSYGGKPYVYLMIHAKQADGTYIIRNLMYEEGLAGSLTPVPLPPGIAAEYASIMPMYALISPSMANNIADVPMGISIYANAIDVLKCIDLAYDGAKTAMEIGRPRIGVTSEMLKIDMDTGTPKPIFDATDIAVYDLGMSGGDDKVRVDDLTTPYRASEFENSLVAQLRVYSQSIGLGESAFRWEYSGVKTATEVIAVNSAMLRAMVKHQDGLRGGIERIVNAILELSGIMNNPAIKVVFDDSVTRDRAAEAAEAWQWVLAGKMPFWRFLVEYRGYDESDAKQIQAEADNQAVNPAAAMAGAYESARPT